ncbi:MAG: T9SS type A sorting domain-containing protein [Bacteroidetes bacterium]|nr:MAG: T9SS type A sorting domain-containing protein [Bacteroidota bacterium]
MMFYYCLIILVCLSVFVCSSQQTIIFSEDFEATTLSQVTTNWNESVNLNGMLLSDDIPPASSGKKSLMMTSIIGQNTGGHLYKMFDRGYDTLYYRFYVKFAETCHPVHHFVHTGGYNPPTRWPQGGAGIKPNGNERFTSGIEPMGNRWEWDFYSYWMHMRGNPQVGTYWGNDFNPTPPSKIKRGEWYCIETMMKTNNPVSSYNGEQALWINDEKIIHLGEGIPNGYWVWDSFHPEPDSLPFEGFQWRNDINLKLNFFWLLFYMTDGEQGQTDTVWFDDVVVSTEYIGPITSVKYDDNRNKFEVYDNFPNPFQYTSNIEYTLPKAGNVAIKIYAQQGQLVRDLYSGSIDAGKHIATWDGRTDAGSEAPNGVYMYRIQFEGHTISGKMLVVK